MSMPIVMFCHWVCRLCYVHIAWCVMTILGLGVFGISPATNVACLMIRRYLNGTHSIGVGMIAEEYKKAFIPSNKVGTMLMFIAFVFFFYYSYGTHSSNSYLAMIGYVCMVLTLFVVLFWYYTMVMMSIYDAMTVKGMLINACVLFRNTLVLAATIGAFIASILIENMCSVIGLFYGFSLVFFATVGLIWYTNPAVRNV